VAPLVRRGPVDFQVIWFSQAVQKTSFSPVGALNTRQQSGKVAVSCLLMAWALLHSLDLLGPD